MPFKDVTVNELRREFVIFALQSGANMSALCARYGISRTHGYALKKLALEYGVDGVPTQSRRPHSSPHQTPPEIEDIIVSLRQDHPDWGARTIGNWMRNRALLAPADSTITTILHRHDLIHPQLTNQDRATSRFERAEPNDLWQMDYLGHKPMQKGRVHPLTIIDDHARFGLSLTACANETRATVWPLLMDCMDRYGMPWAILCDNGPPWGSSVKALTIIDVWLIQLGITPMHGRPIHPQTQGKIERWHRTISGAVFGPERYVDLGAVQHAFDQFLICYNTERPHQALDNDVPINRYHPSPRSRPARIEPPAYDDGLETRKVRQSGEIHDQGARWRISEALAGQWVTLQPTHTDGEVEVYYSNHRVRIINLRDRKVSTMYPVRVSTISPVYTLVVDRKGRRLPLFSPLPLCFAYYTCA